MKHNTLEDTSYWPGYVDALVNVVLNMLFLVGLMAVGLVTLNIEALGNFKSSVQAGQLQKISEDNMLLASLGTLLNVLPPPPAPPVPPKALAPPVAPARQIAPVAAAATPAAPQPSVQPAALRVGLPFVLSPVGQEQNFVQTQAAGVLGSASRPNVFYFQALQYQLSPAQAADLRQLFAASPASSRWVLLVSVPRGQGQASRDAFWRLSSVREQLTKMGAKPEAITLRTVDQEQSNFSNGRRLFVYALAN